MALILRAQPVADCCACSTRAPEPMHFWIRPISVCDSPLSWAILTCSCRPGQLVVFPSYLFHEVTPYYGSDTRITVASNCWFTA